MNQPALVVLAGLPGTGKTTLARALAAQLGACYLRIDAIETVVVRCGLAQPPVGPVGYAVAHEIAAGTLAIGVPVVIDAVNPIPEARQAWPELASLRGAHLVVFETVLADLDEHRRRVMQRQPDMVAQRVPSWDEVMGSDYVAWDESRDGARQVIDMTDSAAGVNAALRVLAS